MTPKTYQKKMFPEKALIPMQKLKIGENNRAINSAAVDRLVSMMELLGCV